MANKRKLSVGSSDDNTANSSHGLQRYLHGITYQFKLSLIVFAHAYDLKQKDKNFTCTIASEDAKAGKFDDIVYEYRYNGVSNTVYIQAKHKQKASTITEADFINKNDPSKENFRNRPFALFPYFKSFLELRQNNESNTSSEPHNSNQQQLHIKEFVLTTNAPIDKSMLSDCLLESVERKENNEMEDFFAANSKESTKNTCYKFNWQILKATHADWIDNLKKASNCCTLAVVLANAIFEKKKIKFNKKIAQFKSAIVHNILGPARNQEMGIYEINEAFITPNTPETVKFKTEFEKEYKKLYVAQTDFWEDVKTNGIMTPKNIMKDAEKLPNTPLPDDEIKDEDVKQFFEQFIIASNTLHEEALDAKVIEQWKTKIVAGPTMDLLRSATASENAYANMMQVVLDWIKSKNGKPIKENDIEKIYKTIICKIQFIRLQGFTEKRVSEFRETIIKIEPERLKSCTIYSQLSPANPESQIFYQSSYDIALVAKIVYETLALLTTDTFKYDYLFLDDKGFLNHHSVLKEIFKYIDQNIVVVVEVQNDRNTEEIKEHLNEMFNTVAEGTHENEAQMILEDTNDFDAMTPIEHSAEHTTGANEKEKMNKTQENKVKKVMLIGQTKNPGSEDKFLIKHVTRETFKELCNKLKDALYFGTKEPLEHITEDDDSLQHLYYIIKEKAQLLSGKKDEPSST